MDSLVGWAQGDERSENQHVNSSLISPASISYDIVRLKFLALLSPGENIVQIT